LQHQLRERLQKADDPQYRFIPAYIDLQGVPENDFFRTIAASVVEHAASLFKTSNGQAADSTANGQAARSTENNVEHAASDDIQAIKESVLAEVASIRGECAGTSLPASGMNIGNGKSKQYRLQRRGVRMQAKIEALSNEDFKQMLENMSSDEVDKITASDFFGVLAALEKEKFSVDGLSVAHCYTMFVEYLPIDLGTIYFQRYLWNHPGGSILSSGSSGSSASVSFSVSSG
jgi:hypothetical protein